MERAECEPPPSLTMSMLLSSTYTSSNGTPSHSATHWAEGRFMALSTGQRADDDIDPARADAP
jgi:hypothetical protein